MAYYLKKLNLKGALISPSTRAFTVRKKRAPLTSVTNPWALLKL